MRPSQLTYPFKGDTPRAIFVRDRVWYVPKSGAIAPYTFPGWKSSDFFGNDNPVHVEYCSGNGAWVAARAAAEPSLNWVAVEQKFDRVRKIWSKIQNMALHNLVVVYGEALSVTENYFPVGSVAAVYVNFPDPWPKRHHARFRLIALPFVEQLSRCLKEDATITLVTDDIPYSTSMIELFTHHSAFSSRLPSPYYTEDWEDYGSSYFEALWRSKGSVIRYHSFMRMP